MWTDHYITSNYQKGETKFRAGVKLDTLLKYFLVLKVTKCFFLQMTTIVSCLNLKNNICRKLTILNGIKATYRALSWGLWGAYLVPQGPNLWCKI